jgi:hypothetical protein
MTEWIEYLTSSRGMALLNGAACAFFLASTLVAIFRQTIPLGSFNLLRIQKSDSPRAYWAVIFLFGAIAVWTGVTALSGLR